MIKNISDQEFIMMQEDSKSTIVLIDIRTRNEFERGHLENAKNLDIFSDNFEEEVNKLDKSKVYVIYCRSGARGIAALNVFKKLGFKEVYNLENGIYASDFELVR